MKHPGLYDDQWWIDHLENKMQVQQDEEMKLLLKNSWADRERLRKLEKLRRLVKESDDSPLPEDGHFYEQLHDRIMRAVLNDDTVPVATIHALPRRFVSRRRFQD